MYVASTPSRQKSWKERRLRVSVLAEMAIRRERVAQRLAQLRETHDLTQEQAAARVGVVTTRQWQRWEAGESTPYPRNLDAIAAAFGIEVADFFTNDAAMPDESMTALRYEVARLREQVQKLTELFGDSPPDAETGPRP